MTDDGHAFRAFMENASRARRAQAAVNEILAGVEWPKRQFPPLIGIGGWPEAGKDALADFLEKNHGYRRTFTSEDLAKALYRANPWIVVDKPYIGPMGIYEGRTWVIPAGSLMKYQKIVDAIGYNRAKEQNEVRDWLKVLGNDIGREMLSETIWVDKLQDRIAGWLDEGHPVVVTGIRYQNDLTLIDAYEGLTVWIDRPGVEGSSHRSDTELTRDDFDVAIMNDGPLDYLEQQARLMDAQAREAL